MPCRFCVASRIWPAILVNFGSYEALEALYIGFDRRTLYLAELGYPTGCGANCGVFIAEIKCNAVLEELSTCDQTGNRRFWTVESSGKIDFQQLTPEKVKQIWAQANALLHEGGLQSFRLTDSERNALAARNSSHTVKMKGEAEIEDLLNSSGKHKMAYREMTITEWKGLHIDVLRPYTVNQIGRVLDKLGVEMKTKKVNGKVAKVRLLPYIAL